MLDDAGYTKGADGIRTLKDGKPFEFKFSVGIGILGLALRRPDHLQEHGKTWRDSSRSTPRTGPRSSPATLTDPSTPASSGATPARRPFEFYRGVMSQKVVVPVGAKANENYHRFGDPEATATLDKLAATADAGSAEDARQLPGGTLQRRSPGDPAVLRPGVGRLHRPAIHGLAQQRQPVRHALGPLRHHSAGSDLAQAGASSHLVAVRGSRPRTATMPPHTGTAPLPPAGPGPIPGRRNNHQERSGTMVFILRRLGFYIIAFWACITLNFFLPQADARGPCQHECSPKSRLRCARTRSMPSGGSSAWTTGPCGSSTSPTSATSSAGTWASRSPGSPPRSPR